MKILITIILTSFIVSLILFNTQQPTLKGVAEYITESEKNRELQQEIIDKSDELIEILLERNIKIENELNACLDIIVESYYREAIWNPKLEIYSSYWSKRTN